MKKRKILWFVLNNGVLDFVGMTKQEALEMAQSPEGDKSLFSVEKWRLKDNKYVFDKVIQTQEKGK